MVINTTDSPDRKANSAPAGKHVRSSSYQHDEETLFAPVPRHMSMEGVWDPKSIHSTERKHPTLYVIRQMIRAAAILSMILAIALVMAPLLHSRGKIRTIDAAIESLLDIGTSDDGTPIQLWYRTWGNPHGIPVLYVHGGPGNSISDIRNGNARFFDAKAYFVIEVDQRGTGKSQPSVRDSWHNMKYYFDITIDQMSHDYELVRSHLGIDKWLVFGGSWGSTLSLYYATAYPERCLGLIIRGIFLNSREELEDISARKSYITNPRRLGEFDRWYQVAADEAIKNGQQPLDPNDVERFLRINEEMIQRGDKNAIWHYHVFENNLMAISPAGLLDPEVIDENKFPEAQSVAFFESRLFLHGAFEAPINILERVDKLQGVDLWMCQGLNDEICPPQYAEKLVDALQKNRVPVTARFIHAGHPQSDETMAACLETSLSDFQGRHQKLKRGAVRGQAKTY